MKKLTNKRGISLIVLVITIIVMIILAAAIILALSNAGIIGKANEAKTVSDNANILEAANLASAEWELEDKLGKDPDDAVTYITDKLKAQGFTEEQINATLNISADGKVSLKGNGQNSEVSWEDASEKSGTVAATLEVGDYITYNSGVSGMTTTWKVLYNDVDNGVQIVPTDVIDTLEVSSMEDINNHIDNLNQISQKYINTKFAKSARAFGTNPIDPVDNTETHYFRLLNVRDEYYFTDDLSDVSIDVVELPVGKVAWTSSRIYILYDEDEGHLDLGLGIYPVPEGMSPEYVFEYGCAGCTDEEPDCYDGMYCRGFSDSKSAYVLPVVTLYNGLKVTLTNTSAENSSTNPYVID